MGKKDTSKWRQFGDILTTGNSVPSGWIGRKTLSKWIAAGLVRRVAMWEEFRNIGSNGVFGWTVDEVVATEKGLANL